MLVVFGRSPESYLVIAGRRFICKEMPESLAGGLSSVIPTMHIDWISVDSECKTWVGYNYVKESFNYDKQINSTILDHLAATNGKPRANYVTFPSESGSYFIKHVAHGGWSAHLEPPYAKKIAELRGKNPNFDSLLTSIIFGKDDTHIYLFETGFIPKLSPEANDPEHILYKTLLEFLELSMKDRGNPWLLLKQSKLCFYDSRYFFLAFKQPNSSLVQYRWNLPPEMNEKFEGLRKTAELPDEVHAISLEKQNIIVEQQATAMNQQLATQSRLMMQAANFEMLSATMRNISQSSWFGMG